MPEAIIELLTQRLTSIVPSRSSFFTEHPKKIHLRRGRRNMVRIVCSYYLDLIEPELSLNRKGHK